MSVDYDVLEKFTDLDSLELDFQRVTDDITNIDIDYGVDVIFNYYRKFGFFHYKIREEEKHQQLQQIKKFNVNGIFENNQIIQTMHGLRL